MCAGGETLECQHGEGEATPSSSACGCANVGHQRPFESRIRQLRADVGHRPFLCYSVFLYSLTAVLDSLGWPPADPLTVASVVRRLI